MIKDAARSLRKDLDRAVFYWIVFILSSMFMFTFFHLALSEAVGVTFIYSNNDLPTYLTVFDVLICMVVIFLANDFYVKKKSKEMAVILICGGTYLQLVEFLLIQTGILMVFSIPVGIGLGWACFPLLSLLIKTMSGCEIEIGFGMQSVALTASVIILEVFWCTMLNLGYAYRNSICSLLRGEEKIKLRSYIRLSILAVRVCCTPAKNRLSACCFWDLRGRRDCGAAFTRLCFPGWKRELWKNGGMTGRSWCIWGCSGRI